MTTSGTSSGAKSSQGSLYGIGVGPGDPELLTIKAQRILQTVPVICFTQLDDGKQITKGYAFPAYRESLKAIARSLDFQWRQDDVTGEGSMALYLQYVESGSLDRTTKDKIVVYNEDDCFATMHIYDWVMAQET